MCEQAASNVLSHDIEHLPHFLGHISHVTVKGYLKNSNCLHPNKSRRISTKPIPRVSLFAKYCHEVIMFVTYHNLYGVHFLLLCDVVML